MADLKLRDYQLEGANFLARRKAAILADEMGIGKTAQVISGIKLLNAEMGSIRTLIIVPTFLVSNWKRELELWYEEATFRIVVGDKKDRFYTYLLPIPILVTSYENIREDSLLIYNEVIFDLVILDEAQYIKNTQSLNSIGCRLLRSNRRWAVTGTPIENSLDDLRALLSFLFDTSEIQNYDDFKLNKLKSNSLLRRNKTDVLSQLPPVIESNIELELNEYQKAEYDKLMDGLSDDGQNDPSALFALISQLKIVCNYDSTHLSSAKFDFILDMVSCNFEKVKFVVFSQYVKTLNILFNKISGSNKYLLTGALDRKERDRIIETFNSNASPSVLLVSLKAGGIGINLPSASHVVFIDRWWNPAIENQAIARALRFERALPLHVIRFKVLNSIEERIETILIQKKVLFEKFIGSGLTFKQKVKTSNAFTIQDLKYILGFRSQ